MTNQHSSKTYMFLLKCLHEMNENVTHPFPLLEPSLTPSRMLNPSVRKTLFSKQKVFVLENIIPNFGKIYWTTLRGELLSNYLKQSWVFLRDELLDNSPRQFFGKSSFEIHLVTTFFHVMHSHLLFEVIPVHMKCNMPFHNKSC